MTVQPVSDNKNEQASRLKPPPPSIGDLLQVANSLPPDYPLPDLGEVLRLRLTPDFRKPNPEKGFRDFLDRMRTQFPDFVTALENLEKPHDSVYLRYESARAARDTLRAIARMQDKKPGDEVPVIGINRLVSIRVGAAGKVEIKLDPFVQKLGGVDVRRIRECEICRGIFWAGRIDQKCCSRAHAKTLRTRVWRRNYLELHKPRRVKRQEKRSHST